MRKTEIEETNMTDINKIENGPMLNLYPDSLGGDLEAVADLFEKNGFADAFSSMYILPSIYHSDLDRGFSVIDYDLEETFHSEKALLRLGRQNIDLKLDFVLNHASVQSPQFQDLLENGSRSEYRDFFINWNTFWENCGEMTEDGYIQPEQKYLDPMFFRKPGLPLLMVEMADGSRIPYWNTFYQEIRDTDDYHTRYLGQMDLNIKSEKVWDFYRKKKKKHGKTFLCAMSAALSATVTSPVSRYFSRSFSSQTAMFSICSDENPSSAPSVFPKSTQFSCR